MNKTVINKSAILDMNSFRNPIALELLRDLSADGELTIGVIETSLKEAIFTKSPSRTLFSNLKALVPMKDKVVVYSPLSDLVELERAKQCSIVPFVDLDLSKALRSILSFETYDDFLAKKDFVLSIQAVRVDPKYDISDRKILLKKVLDGIESDLSPVLKKELKKSLNKATKNAKEELLLQLIPLVLGSPKGRSEVLNIVWNSLNISSRKRKEHLWRDSTTVRLVQAYISLGLEWKYRNGFESASAKTIENDFFDLEYAIVSSFNHVLISKDKGAQQMLRLLRDIQYCWSKI